MYSHSNIHIYCKRKLLLGMLFFFFFFFEQIHHSVISPQLSKGCANKSRNTELALHSKLENAVLIYHLWQHTESSCECHADNLLRTTQCNWRGKPGYITLTIMHADIELAVMQVSYDDVEFKVPATKKVACLYFLVDNSYYKIALYL